jgi:hypothetical protein
MNSDLSGWNVAKVTTLYGTFTSASTFTGSGFGVVGRRQSDHHAIHL